MKINVGLAQISPKLADVRSNCELHLQFVERAVAQKVDLLVFPELSLTGYTLQDAVGDVAHAASPSDPLMSTMLEASQRLDAIQQMRIANREGHYLERVIERARDIRQHAARPAQ